MTNGKKIITPPPIGFEQTDYPPPCSDQEDEASTKKETDNDNKLPDMVAFQ